MKTVNVQSILKHYAPHMRPFKRDFALLFLWYALAALCVSVATPLIYKSIMDALTVRSDASMHRIGTLFLLLTTVIVIQNVFFRAADHITIRVQSTILKRLYDYTLAELSEKSYAFFSNSFAGGLVAKTKRFVRAFETIMDQIVFQLWMNGLELIASITVLFFLSPVLGLLFVGWVMLYVVFVFVLVQRALPRNARAAEEDSHVTAHLADIITNILTVKTFGSSRSELGAFAATTEGQRAAQYTAWRYDGFWMPLWQGSMISLFELIIVGTALWLWKEGTIGLGIVLIVIMYVIRSFGIVWNVSRSMSRAFAALTDADEMVAILDEPLSVRDPINPEPAHINAGALEFTHVSHSYDGTNGIFNDFTVSIAAGERVALVGHSGSGKTTFVKLLLRFADVSQGSITIDGQNIAHITQDDLRRSIAYVPQDPILFHRSLFDNIAYGSTNATRESVERAAMRAHAHEFIVRLPHGYETLVGERGVKLSGGERQRVAIARALLKNAPIVILDEATSSLDSISERFIQAAFDELMEGRTTIVIAHRLSTIQHMDRIIVLDHGRVVEEGTHLALIARSGEYAALWHSQVGGFLQEDSTDTEDQWNATQSQ